MHYDVIDLSHQLFKWWLGATRQQAITWTNVDASSKVFCGIHLSEISQEMHMN